MGLFFNKKKKARKESVFFEQTFVQAPSFKGFKRAKLTTYGYEPVQKSLSALESLSLEGRTITLQGVRYEGGRFIKVYVDEHHVGTMFGDTYKDRYASTFEPILSGKATAAHVRIEGEDSFLFVKLGE